MKKLIFFAAGMLFCTALFAVDNTSQISWSLLESGSWEENKTLYNRGEIRFDFLPPGLTFRGEVLDRRPLNFELETDAPFGDPEKWTTNILGGLYHTTGSRILFGVLDEWGLSARIRNPWIRSPPYSENHKPLIADIKTTASVTKNDEVYLYLSSPFLDILENIKLRGFLSAQTETGDINPAFAGGVELKLPDKTGILIEIFHTSATLPQTKSSSWFSNPPRLLERKFKLFAAGVLFHNQLLSVSSDLALSETFAWGNSFYGSFGINITPLLASGRILRPLSISFSAEGAGEKFIYRDGAGHGEGFRSAAKVEWKRSGNSLIRFNMVLRAPAIGEKFNRSSTGFYYRFPAKKPENMKFPVMVTRISFTADRNADNPLKINDKFTGNIGFMINLDKISVNTPLNLNILVSARGLAEANGTVSYFPIPDESWIFDSTEVNCDFTWSPLIYQFKLRIGFTDNIKKEENLWGFSFCA